MGGLLSTKSLYRVPPFPITAAPIKWAASSLLKKSNINAGNLKSEERNIKKQKSIRINFL